MLTITIANEEDLAVDLLFGETLIDRREPKNFINYLTPSVEYKITSHVWKNNVCKCVTSDLESTHYDYIEVVFINAYSLIINIYKKSYVQLA